ncbi:MAG: carbohydrate ABC transporter permease [Actinomycetota bacterium]
MRRSGFLALPFVAGLTLLLVVPALGAVVLALTDYSGVGDFSFVGLQNFERMLSDDGFWRSLANSGFHVMIAVPLRMAAVVGLALLLHRDRASGSFGRTGVFLPSVVPDAAYALLWLWLLNPLYGPLTALWPGDAGPLSGTWSARVSIAIMSVFQIGEGFVIALAARRALPRSLYDAASVDGARPWFVLRRITLPLMAPVLLLLTARDVVLALQMNFVPALMVTDGGPRLATTYLPLFAYRQAFRYFRLGYASTIALSMFAITAIAMYVQYRVARRYRLL